MSIRSIIFLPPDVKVQAKWEQGNSFTQRDLQRSLGIQPTSVHLLITLLSNNPYFGTSLESVPLKPWFLLHMSKKNHLTGQWLMLPKYLLTRLISSCFCFQASQRAVGRGAVNEGWSGYWSDFDLFNDCQLVYSRDQGFFFDWRALFRFLLLGGAYVALKLWSWVSLLNCGILQCCNILSNGQGRLPVLTHISLWSS